MHSIQLVVFDMAGSTIRDKGNVGKAFIEAFKANGIGIPLEEVKKVMGWRKIVDVEEGRSAGCGLVVGVTTGAYTRGQMEQYKPDKIIDSMAELSSLI